MLLQAHYSTQEVNFKAHFDVTWATFERTQTRDLSHDAAVPSFLTRPEGEISLGGISGAFTRALLAIFSPRSYFREVTVPATFAARGIHETPARTSSR